MVKQKKLFGLKRGPIPTSLGRTGMCIEVASVTDRLCKGRKIDLHPRNSLRAETAAQFGQPRGKGRFIRIADQFANSSLEHLLPQARPREMPLVSSAIASG